MIQTLEENNRWQKYTLSQLGAYLNGRGFKKDEWRQSGTPIIRIQNLNNRNSKFNYSDKEYEERYKVKRGDLLVSWAASLGVYIWDREDAWLNQHIFKVVPNEALVTHDFLFYVLKNVMSDLFQKTHGTGMVHITKGDFESHEVYVPDIGSQKEIVKGLRAALSLVKSSSHSVKSARSDIGKLKQSVIMAAISGRLTEDWREKNSTKDSTEDILETVRLKRLDTTRTLSEKAKFEKVYKTEEESSQDILPENWSYVTLDKLCSSFQYGTSTKSESEGKVPVLRMGNLQNGEIVWDDLVYTSDDSEINKYKLKPGDVLFNRTNSPELVGKTSIYRGEKEAIYAGYLIKINNYDVLDSEYLNYCLNSNYARNYYYQVKTDGVSQSNINAQKLGKFEVPFCHPEEQKEIVRRVKYYLDVIDQMKVKVERAEAQVERLTSAILAKKLSSE